MDGQCQDVAAQSVSGRGEEEDGGGGHLVGLLTYSIREVTEWGRTCAEMVVVVMGGKEWSVMGFHHNDESHQRCV